MSNSYAWLDIFGLQGMAAGNAAYGAKMQASAQKNMLQYQAQAAAIQQQNVKNARDANITAVQDQAARNSTMLSRQQATIKGAQTAAMGAQGLGGSVTAADIAKDTFTKQQMDQMTLQYNANVKAWDITNRANNELWRLGAQKEQYDIGAENEGLAGTIATQGSLLNSATQIATEAAIFAM